MNSEFFSTLPATGTLAYESMQELGAINSKADRRNGVRGGGAVRSGFRQVHE